MDLSLLLAVQIKKRTRRVTEEGHEVSSASMIERLYLFQNRRSSDYLKRLDCARKSRSRSFDRVGVVSEVDDDTHSLSLAEESRGFS
jgi:hypothetical protein